MLKKIFVWCFGILAVLAVSLPLFHPTFFRLHDFVHAARIVEIVLAVKDGNFPVSWTSDFGYGYGMPLFEFYAPLPYYTGAIFYALGFKVVTAVKFLFAICSILTFAGMYRLGKHLYGRAAGILAAVALTLAPYRALNLYVRGALSEAWGIMALPWVLLGVVLVIKQKKHGWWTLLAGLVMLLLSHNITTLIFIPFSLVFAGSYWLMTWPAALQVNMKNVFGRGLRLIRLGLIYALGLGLASFYIFPALIEKDYTRVNQIFGGYFAYVNHFLYIRQFFIPNWGYGGSAPWPNDGISFFLGYGQLLGLGVVIVGLMIAIVTWMKSRWLQTQHVKLLTKNSTLIWLPALCLSLFLLAGFMTLFKSQKIWDAIPVMVTVQFPWRFLSIMILFLALLVGMSSLYIKRKFLRYLYIASLSLFMIITNAPYFRPEKYLSSNDDYYYTDRNLIRKQMSSILPDYIPKQMPAEFPAVLVGQVLMKNPDGATVSASAEKTQLKSVTASVKAPTQFDFAIADYPGWQVYIDQQLVTKKQGVIGNLAVMVPAGQHQVEAKFTETPIRHESNLISMVSWLILGSVALVTQLLSNVIKRKVRYESV